ncbi:pyridoxal phosphate-dependent aminotransferase [Phycobacter azelaicus]|uniref:pyridoxal phosphate-dependent aminotransferase n=1 Tax=Phycobacter azelaicus TaxID=2668075 RepID=UPI0018695DEA|nr:pyridoxal phosphate-dependent aminotransferase [Phycobacter azelaicus]MBE1295419.1 aminotransferase class I/II-fold pyridoxal phosphate-dependent enzyme [Paracoccaceae bacterium]
MLKNSDRLDGIALSEIVAISEGAARMRADGHDVLALSTGEPDFPTPPHVCNAAHEAMQAGQTRYAPTAGTAQLRGAIADSAGVEAKNVIVSTGAKQVLANLFLATLNSDDEVIVPAPYWTSYSDIISMSGGRTVLLHCGAEAGFKMTPEQLEAAITPRTRWLLLNSPSNPSGAVYSKEELAALGQVLERYPHIWIASDEIYGLICYRSFASFRHACPALADRTLVINGVSKAHAMTGWRVGWGIGPAELIKAMTAVQGQITSGACSISQAAAHAALTGDQRHIASRAAEFRARRDMVVSALNEIPGITCAAPDGAFYVFPSCQGILGCQTPDGKLLETDADFCAYVLAFTGLAIVPGRAFGLPGHFRLSYAYARRDLQDGCLRLKRAVAALNIS